jgi:hypothetical protein
MFLKKGSGAGEMYSSMGKLYREFWCSFSQKLLELSSTGNFISRYMVAGIYQSDIIISAQRRAEIHCSKMIQPRPKEGWVDKGGNLGSRLYSGAS